MNTYITYGAAIFVACLGAVLSYVEFLDDALWLARSGSVIVVLGILYTILEFYAHQDDHKVLKREAPNAYANLKYEHKRLDEKKVKIWKKKAEALEDDLKTGLEKRTMKHEGILLMTGTLIWGFGDLPFRFLVSG
ncbi:hypothetical protein [Marinomonas sp. GJ51-6]|uniref:hypothetical protein n=1 Tax=Marinomonas sp. GJ51-6 TaxID=2992802 RepID=UPI0029345CC3|nr:hypothetical protein [Marinomonas sp. GJ51-6]WOD07809.1 hypothetical protein ONZ50_01130 [Marinomonas sp. GJ51-6]